MDSMNSEEDGGVIGYMCATDWDCEIGANYDGSTVFPSPEAALEHLKCAKSCGIVEVKVYFSKVVMEGTKD